MRTLSSIFGADLSPWLLAQSSAWDKLWFGGLTEKGNFSSAVDAVFFYIFWVSTAFFVVLMVLMVWFAFKYKRVPGTLAESSPSHHTPLELAWSIVPLILMAVMFFWGFEEYIKLQIAPVTAEKINVTAQQWAWSWEYDNGANSRQLERIADMDSPVFAVPANRPVEFLMSSTDVIHSMYIPAFRVKKDVFPNRYTSLWFEAAGATHETFKEGDELKTRPLDPNQPGYYLACTEYCGDQHSQMWARVIVLNDVDYRQWKDAQASTDSIPPVELGQILWTSKGCVSCHTTDGKSKTGPTWKGIWGKAEQFEDGSNVFDHHENWESYVRESILEPGKHVVKGYPNQMASYQGRMTDREIRSIALFIQTLSDNPADVQAAQEASDREMAEKEAAKKAAESGAEAGAQN